MTDRDPDLQHQVDRAAQELANRARATTALADVDTWARTFIEDLYAQGWRPVPRPPQVAHQGAQDPTTAAAGAEAVRTAMRNARDAKTQGDRDA